MRRSVVESESSIDFVREDKKNEIANNHHIDRINEIIDAQNDTDLNKLIDTINKIRSKENLSTFNKSNINLSFKRNEVDKFTQSKKMHSDFSVDINFEIFGKDTV